jgi:diguanylate cyclase (GGDEF)-like protein
MQPIELVNESKTAHSRNQGRILIVSDGPFNELCRLRLSRAGFAVVGVTTGAAALVSARQTRPHLIVADATVRGIGSEELTRALLQAKEQIPLILVGTASADLARREQALAAGAFDYFSLPDEIPLLLRRAVQLVKQKQTIDELRAEADRDYQTGLSTRRRFRTALGQEVERWRRYRVPCGLLLADIDLLKKINDAHGHSAGDRAIRHVAGTLTELSRDNDTAARLGGEEFALLLAGADEHRAAAAAERVREAVAATEVEGVGIVTVSLGVAACPAHAISERNLYAAADAALYESKNTGRNCVSVAPAADLMLVARG